MTDELEVPEEKPSERRGARESLLSDPRPSEAWAGRPRTWFRPGQPPRQSGKMHSMTVKEDRIAEIHKRVEELDQSVSQVRSSNACGQSAHNERRGVELLVGQAG